MLRNKFTSPAEPFGITDAAELAEREAQFARIRLIELSETPIRGDFDYDHMKAIHRHIFSDVYEWAGEERTAPIGFMTKDGHAYYGAGAALTAAAEAEYAKIAKADFLRNMAIDQFVSELAERWGELNVIHSFREGNTRAQFVFFTQLCNQAGYSLDANAFQPGNPLRDEFVRARFHSQDTGSNAQLARVLTEMIIPLD